LSGGCGGINEAKRTLQLGLEEREFASTAARVFEKVGARRAVDDTGRHSPALLEPRRDGTLRRRRRRTQQSRGLEHETLAVGAGNQRAARNHRAQRVQAAVATQQVDSEGLESECTARRAWTGRRRRGRSRGRRIIGSRKSRIRAKGERGKGACAAAAAVERK
jgi:hypothetical protein